MGMAVEKAYKAIRQAIMSGAYPPGSHLKEEELAARTGLSRTPIREAMRRLHAEGWVNMAPNRGVFVTTLDRRGIEEIFNLRMLLETYGAELAATRMSPDQLHQLRVLNRYMEQAAEDEWPRCLEAVAQANDKFHKLILHASGSRRLQAVLSSIIEAPLVFSTFQRYSHDDLHRSIAYHAELIDAFQARDPAWAHSAMAGHIRSAFHIFDKWPTDSIVEPHRNSTNNQASSGGLGQRRVRN